MTKDEFIKSVSKIDQTFEDEFKAEFNSPELIWEFLTNYPPNPKCDDGCIYHCTKGGQHLAECIKITPSNT
jgi:hypothetical protein